MALTIQEIKRNIDKIGGSFSAFQANTALHNLIDDVGVHKGINIESRSAQLVVVDEIDNFINDIVAFRELLNHAVISKSDKVTDKITDKITDKV